MGEGRSPGGPPVVAGGGAGAVAAAGPGSDGAGAVQRVAGPCEAVGRPGVREWRGLESHAQKAPPAAPHLPPEPPARALVPQQHLRGKHQSSEPWEVVVAAELGQPGTRPGRGEGPGYAARPLPLPPHRCPWC